MLGVYTNFQKILAESWTFSQKDAIIIVLPPGGSDPAFKDRVVMVTIPGAQHCEFLLKYYIGCTLR